MEYSRKWRDDLVRSLAEQRAQEDRLKDPAYIEAVSQAREDTTPFDYGAAAKGIFGNLAKVGTLAGKSPEVMIPDFGRVPEKTPIDFKEPKPIDPNVIKYLSDLEFKDRQFKTEGEESAFKRKVEEQRLAEAARHNKAQEGAAWARLKQERDLAANKPFLPLKEEKLTEGEAKSAKFAAQMKQAEDVVKDAIAKGVDPTANLQVISSHVSDPGMTTQLLTSGDERRYADAARAWIMAKLRPESGAVISPSEIKAVYQSFFPQRGDSPQVIAEKEKMREQEFQSSIAISGKGFKRIPEVRVMADTKSVQPENALTKGLNQAVSGPEAVAGDKVNFKIKSTGKTFSIPKSDAMAVESARKNQDLEETP